MQKREALEGRLLAMEDERAVELNRVWNPHPTRVKRAEEEEEGEGEEEEGERGEGRREGKHAKWYGVLRPVGGVRGAMVAKERVQGAGEGNAGGRGGRGDDFETLTSVIRDRGKGYGELVSLLEKGVFWDAREEVGRRNAVHIAAGEGREEMLQALLSHAPSSAVEGVDRRRMTPLLIAAEAGAGECVRLLLRSGARADARDRPGETGKGRQDSWCLKRGG